MLFKHAITRFYQIEYNTLKLGHKNYLSEQVKEIVLGYKISKIIVEAAQDAFRDDIIEFQKALNVLSSIDLSFFNITDHFALNEFIVVNDKKTNDDEPKFQFENLD